MVGLIIAILFSWFPLGADRGVNLSDTLELGIVDVYGDSLGKYAMGQYILRFGKESLEEFGGQSLGDFLQARSGLFLRQYGPGMVASLTMRGTSAGHNAVFWNGLPINSPSLGQMDFSILPVGGFDLAQVHFGGSGALYGTDAIGGSIHLSNELAFNQGLSFNTSNRFGSFGAFHNQVQGTYSTAGFSSKTQVYRQQATNNFPFTNLAKIGTPEERQDHAAVFQWGAVQDLAWNLSSQTQVSTSLWWNSNDRQIQPVMGSNNRDLQLDRNLRWVADLHHFENSRVWNLKTGVVWDKQLFNEQADNRTSQFFLAGELDWEISKMLQSKSGVRLTDVRGNLSTFSENDFRVELYQSTNIRPTEKLGFSLNLRQLVYSGNFAPFTPSLGMEYTVFEHEQHKISGSAALSRSFKVPSLNDRFWIPGGNPALLPERSLSGEIGMGYLYNMKNRKFNAKVTYYRMAVDQWIVWMPQPSYWAPQNIQEVNNQGLEVFLDSDIPLSFGVLQLTANHAWNATQIIKTGDSSRANNGNQLPYTPAHKSQATARIKNKSMGYFINTHRVGTRYISMDNQTSLSPYLLVDIGIDRKWSLGKNLRGSMGFQVNNIGNTEYEVLRLRPMPGRNFQFNLTISQ
ncbi:TonB-dependent receptor plug domain-containing protein [Lunatibacter salilacus]|uniref:TonB-dependent receptor plug domain-containing protein n=1 Tax=Lunatibacter salilacus TaxID=2483804 RepID=UPI001F3F9F8B|nr:TonB-dependent receptor plug domain-containing protein [Lunatibacter salilacus]